MKKYSSILSLSAVLFFVSTTLAQAHFVGGGDHGSYAEELFVWPPGLRQVHYWGEILFGALVVGLIVVSLMRKFKARKKAK